MSAGECKRCFSADIDPFGGWNGMCKPCYDRTIDDSKCRKCNGMLPQGRPTGSICAICKDLLLTETLRSQLLLQTDESAAMVKVRKTGCGATLAVPVEFFRHNERYNGSAYMKQLHEELDALEAREAAERAAGCVARSPWPRCAVHSKEGALWLVELLLKHGAPIPERVTCSCQW